MSKKKLMALLLTGVMATASVCVPVLAEENTEEAAEEAAEEASETEEEGQDGDTPLVVGSTGFSEKFSSFFAESVPDQEIVDLTNVALYGTDRTGAIIYNGIEGETHEYNGTDYTYYGISDLTVTENEDTTVTILSFVTISFSPMESR